MYRLKSRAGRVMPARFFSFVFCSVLAGRWQVRNWHSEGFGEVFGGCVQVEFLVGLPKIQNVSLDSTRRFETAEHLTFQIRGKLPAGFRMWFMDWTRAAMLDALHRNSADSFQNLLQRNLLTQ